MESARRFTSPFLFALVVAAVYTSAAFVRSVLDTVDSPHVLAGALAIDLTVLVPASYYLLVARRYRLPAVSVAGVFILSLLAAAWIIPDTYRRVLTPVEIAAAMAEVALLGFITWKAAGGIRRFRAAMPQQSEDVLAAIRDAAREVVDWRRGADMLAYELAIFYYALFSWRRRPVEAPSRHTSYRYNNYGPTLLGLALVLVVELSAVHVLVQMYWSTVAAWILTLLTLYGGVWILGDWQALRLRPTVIADDRLVLCAGMRWELDIPFAHIDSFRRVSALEDKPRGTLSLVSFGDATFEITTTAAIEARGAYGFRRSTQRIWFAVDDPARFETMLSRRLADPVRSPQDAP